MMSPISQKDFLNSFTSLCEGYYVDEKQALQVKAQLIDTNISYKYFFIGRIYQSLISIPLSIIIYYILT